MIQCVNTHRAPEEEDAVRQTQVCGQPHATEEQDEAEAAENDVDAGTTV